MDSQGKHKNIEELQKAFKVRWCDNDSQDSFSQYFNICKGPCESTRDFTDRFNLVLKKIRSKVGSEQAIIDHYLSSLEGTLQFKLRTGHQQLWKKHKTWPFRLKEILILMTTLNKET
jgi:hypothetical protein